MKHILLILALCLPGVATAAQTDPNADLKAQLAQSQAQIRQLETQVRQLNFALADFAMERDECVSGHSALRVALEDVQAQLGAQQPQKGASK